MAKNTKEKLEKEKGIIKEFKEFISKGNVVDLAVGVVVGTAFSSIVNSLVNDIIMPFVGVIIGGIDFSKLTITFKDANINYGLFIQNIINFLIIAACVFFFVKVINTFKRKKEEPAPAAKPDDVVLLEEIRDLLKKNK